MTGLLDLPLEIFDLIIEHYVEHAGKDEAWYGRGVCKTFQNAISRQLFDVKNLKCYRYRPNPRCNLHHYHPNAPRHQSRYRDGSLHFADGILRFHIAEVLKYQVNRPYDPSNRILAVLNKMADRLLRIDPPTPNTQSEISATRNAYMIDMIKALAHNRKPNYIPWDTFIDERFYPLEVSAAAAVGNMNAVHRLYRSMEPYMNLKDNIKFSRPFKTLLFGSPIQAAAIKGNLDVLRWLLGKLDDWKAEAARYDPYYSEDEDTDETDSPDYEYTSDTDDSEYDSEFEFEIDAQWCVHYTLDRAIKSAIRAGQIESSTFLLKQREADTYEWVEYLPTLLDIDSPSMIESVLALFSTSRTFIDELHELMRDDLAVKACHYGNVTLLNHILLSCDDPASIVPKVIGFAIKDSDSSSILQTLLQFVDHPPFTYAELIPSLKKGNYRKVHVMLQHGCVITSSIVWAANWGVLRYIKGVQYGTTLLEKIDSGERMMCAYLVYKQYKRQKVEDGQEIPRAIGSLGLALVEAFVESNETWRKIAEELLGSDL